MNFKSKLGLDPVVFPYTEKVVYFSLVLDGGSQGRIAMFGWTKKFQPSKKGEKIRIPAKVRWRRGWFLVINVVTGKEPVASAIEHRSFINILVKKV